MLFLLILWLHVKYIAKSHGVWKLDQVTRQRVESFSQIRVCCLSCFDILIPICYVGNIIQALLQG